jgi:hypothetical protein
MSVEKINVENKQELEQMITEDMAMIEKDLTVICNNVPINDKATLDVLCHDNSGQLVLLQIGIKEDDAMLLQGIQSLDYVSKFKSFLKVTYNKHNINDQETPRLVLIAPSFSETVLHAVAHIQGIHIDMYEWEYLKIGEHKGLHLQSIFTWKSSDTNPIEKQKEEKADEKRHETKSTRKKETTAEPELEKISETEPEEQKEELSFSDEVETTGNQKEERDTLRPYKDEQQKKKHGLF